METAIIGLTTLTLIISMVFQSYVQYKHKVFSNHNQILLMKIVTPVTNDSSLYVNGIGMKKGPEDP